MTLSDKEKRVLKKTKLKNLKRKYSKLMQVPEMMEECIELKSEIDGIERELNSQ